MRQKKQLELAAAEHDAELGKANSSDDEDQLDKLMALGEAPDDAPLAGVIGALALWLRLCD